MGKLPLLAWICVLCLTASAVVAEPLPSYSDLQKLYSDGQYRVVLQKIAQVMQLTSLPAAGYDKVDVLMLKGETLLQTKDQSSALTAFTAAVKEATTVQTGKAAPPPRKPEQIALARATLLLVKKSPLATYTSRTMTNSGKPATFSLLDVSQRPAAFTALFADLKTELTPKAAIAAKGTKLPPIIECVKALGDLRAVELTSTQQTKESDAMLSDLSDQALKLMSAEVKTVSPKVDQLDTAAHEKTTMQTRDPQSRTITTWHGLRGLHPNERTNLEGIQTELEQMVYTSRDFEEVVDKDKAQQFKSLETDATTVGKKAHSTLNDDYRQTTRDVASY